MASSSSQSPDAAERSLCTRRVLGAALAVAALAWAPLVDAQALERAGELWPQAESPRPYWPGEHALELWLWTPLVTLGGCALFLAPGLALAAALGSASAMGRWLLHALALSLLAVSALAGVLGAFAPGLSRGAPFGWSVAALALLASLWLVHRVRTGPRLPWPAQPAALVAPSVVAAWLALALLAPKFHWESFNGDGVHAFESTRLLLVQPTPFWPQEAGDIRGFPGLTSMLFAFPGAWFLRLFGENEGAARVSVVLYLLGVFAAIAALIEDARGRVRALESVLVWCALLVYLLVMAFSASYDPYSADIALPATQDTLTVACVLGAIGASLRGDRAWTALFTALSYVSLPSGLMLLGLWLIAAFVFVRPRPLRGLAAMALALAACALAARAAPVALAALGQPLPGGEYESLLARFAYLQLSDVRRLAFALAPCGIVPGLVLLGWRWFDPLSRALACVALAYFAFFYVQAYVSLHHFVPAMLLPLAAFWRSGPVAAPPTAVRARWAVALGLLAALWLSWPSSWRPLVHARRIGERLHAQVEGYEHSAPASLAAASALRHLFPPGLAAEVPESSYGGSPYIWNRYAQRELRDGARVDYWLTRDDAPPPQGAERVANEGGCTLYVRDREVWRADRSVELPHPPGAPLYAIDRGRLFLGAKPRSEGPAIIDLRALRRRLGQ